MPEQTHTIAIIGSTGAEGSGLAEIYGDLVVRPSRVA